MEQSEVTRSSERSFSSRPPARAAPRCAGASGTSGQEEDLRSPRRVAAGSGLASDDDGRLTTAVLYAAAFVRAVATAMMAVRSVHLARGDSIPAPRVRLRGLAGAGRRSLTSPSTRQDRPAPRADPAHPDGGVGAFRRPCGSVARHRHRRLSGMLNGMGGKRSGLSSSRRRSSDHERCRAAAYSRVNLLQDVGTPSAAARRRAALSTIRSRPMSSDRRSVPIYLRSGGGEGPAADASPVEPLRPVVAARPLFPGQPGGEY